MRVFLFFFHLRIGIGDMYFVIEVPHSTMTTIDDYDDEQRHSIFYVNLFSNRKKISTVATTT